MHFFLLFVVVEVEHKMAPNARCANNGQTDDSLITYSAQVFDCLDPPQVESTDGRCIARASVKSTAQNRLCLTPLSP